MKRDEGGWTEEGGRLGEKLPVLPGQTTAEASPMPETRRSRISARSHRDQGGPRFLRRLIANLLDDVLDAGDGRLCSALPDVIGDQVVEKTRGSRGLFRRAC
jgi:hypothetical protein